MISEGFPSQWPRSLEDPTAIRDNDWEAFRRVETMIDHWDRPGWSPSRRSYHWLLTFASRDALDALVGRCQDAIAHLCLDLVPVSSVHLTMGRLAFTDEISVRQADSTAGAARELCAGLSAFDLAVGPLAGSRGAVRFSVSPWHELLELNRRLHHAATIVGAAPASNSASFRPHISIAYNNHFRPAAPIIEAVASLRGLAPVRASVAEAQLVILRRDAKAYRWESLASVQIGNE